MRIFLLIVLAFILSGCAVPPSTRHTVEMEDLLFIVKDTLSEMEDCVDSNIKRYCEEATRLLDRYPWLVDWDIEVDFVNYNGIRQEEWDAMESKMEKDWDKIVILYPEFRRVSPPAKPNSLKCDTYLDCSGVKVCVDGKCVDAPKENKSS